MRKEENVKATMIIEIMGRPPEHLKKALETHIGKLDSREGVKVISKEFAEPNLVDKEKQLYTSFSEITVEVETLFMLSELIFDFMPSSVEVLEPDNLTINSQESSMFLNDLAGRLHKYDEIAKVAQLRNKQLMAAYENLQGQLSEKAKPKKTEKKKSTKKKKK